MGNIVRRLVHAYENLGLVATAAIVGGFVLLTTAVGVGMVVWMPADHFKSDRLEPASWWRTRPALRQFGLILKNALGVVLAALGVVMAMPLVPGPGLVFILLGFSLLDFAGKRKIERRLLAVPSVIRFINEVRTRFGRAPLILDAPHGSRDAPVEEKR